MRVIEVSDTSIRSVAVSPDSRFVAASAASGTFAAFHWTTGEAVLHIRGSGPADQIAFPGGGWVTYCPGRAIRFERLHTGGPEARHPGPSEWYAGGVAVAPDGRVLVAVADGGPGSTQLLRWSLPGLTLQPGFDGWSPFRRLAFSPNGDYIAGIWPGYRGRWRSDPAGFDVRFARSGGRDFHYPPFVGGTYNAPGFVSFSRDSGTCAFGWEGEFHVLDTSTGTSQYARRVMAEFRDAAFTGSGRAFATVDEAGLLKLWDVGSWEVVREYDWGCGPLTCVAFTADGAAGVCGTADGRLVQFDVDE